MNNDIISLTNEDIFNLSEMAKEKRRILDIGTAPIGENILKILKQLGIQLIYMPIEHSDDDGEFFSGIYVGLKGTAGNERFIGLNTYDYYDNQLFTLAHELYHFYEETEIHFCRITSCNQNKRELKANRFAAEFMLPSDKLTREIETLNKGNKSIEGWNISKVIRFIASIQCQYKLPYKAIVRRLWEINSISKSQYDEIYNIETRRKDSDYYKISYNIDSEAITLLNTRTKKKGADAITLENIISNYEDGLISITEFIDDIEMFDKKIEDFGIKEEIDNEDLEDMKDMFGVD